MKGEENVGAEAGRRPVSRWRAGILATLVVGAVAALGLTAVPSFADHGGPAGVCGIAPTNGVAVRDSPLVQTPFGPGLQVAITVHCNAGSPNDPKPLDVRVEHPEGTAIGAVTTAVDAAASSASTRTLTMDLPVSRTPPPVGPVHPVCVYVNNTKQCVPPSE